LEGAEGGDVVRNVGRVDVDHVAGLEDQIRTQRIRLRHERLHLVAPHVDPGVDVGEVQDAQAVEAGREVGEPQRAPGDVGEAVRAPRSKRAHLVLVESGRRSRRYRYSSTWGAMNRSR